ncbi:MAG: PP2C family protein-serine/threonine phosphatase [Planctomycetota bacterium]|nr:PP2C family protein-serine/threonine phosphatase [Planctomycetota bacterium]
MAQRHLMLVVLDERLIPGAEHLRDRLTNAWSQSSSLEIELGLVDDLRAVSFESIDAVIFLDEGGEAPSSLLGLLTTIEEKSIPVIALSEQPFNQGNPYEFAGAIVERVSVDDHQLTSILRGVLHRQQEITRLQQEAHIAQRYQSGLRNQITQMHEEMHLAAVVQREFLPQEIPSLHGVSFDALWRPAHYVSGDIYDIARLDEDHIGVFLADAAGHGVPAALMTMVIHRSLITKEIKDSSYRLLSPSEVMTRLNNGMIRRQCNNGRFATAVYALINCRERTMAIAGAGHPASKLLRVSGEHLEIESAGSLLGIFEDETFEQTEIALEAGDRLLLFSDGFEQAFPHDAIDQHQRRLPTERYHEEFAAISQQDDPAAMIREIKRRLDDEAGSLHQVDDLTLICMHAGPLEQIQPTTNRKESDNKQFSITL